MNLWKIQWFNRQELVIKYFLNDLSIKLSIKPKDLTEPIFQLLRILLMSFKLQARSTEFDSSNSIIDTLICMTGRQVSAEYEKRITDTGKSIHTHILIYIHMYIYSEVALAVFSVWTVTSACTQKVTVKHEINNY